MGIRAIVGAVVSVFLAIYMYWFVIPVLRTAYTNQIAVINTNSTTMQTLLPIANSWFVILPLLVGLAAGYTIYLYATRVEGVDE
jgi:sterol desaturase/sphingolipid hydroxylase (fatty acid hydroxylase superfamily)